MVVITAVSNLLSYQAFLDNEILLGTLATSCGATASVAPLLASTFIVNSSNDAPSTFQIQMGAATTNNTPIYCVKVILTQLD